MVGCSGWFDEGFETVALLCLPLLLKLLLLLLVVLALVLVGVGVGVSSGATVVAGAQVLGCSIAARVLKCNSPIEHIGTRPTSTNRRGTQARILSRCSEQDLPIQTLANTSSQHREHFGRRAANRHDLTTLQANLEQRASNNSTSSKPRPHTMGPRKKASTPH